MTDMLRRYGKVLTAYIILTCGIWIFGFVVVPQLLMVDYSFWYIDENAQQNAWNEMDSMDSRLSAIDGEINRLKGEGFGDLSEEVTALNDEYLALEKELVAMEELNREPPKEYGFKNYLTLINNTLHRSVFLKSIWSSCLITFLAFVICYPVAYYLAKVARAKAAALLFLGLIIPYWVNEILRTFAWLMILSYKGFLNTLLLKIGFISEPIDFMNGNIAVLVGMAYCYILFMVFPMYNTIQTLDKNQIEAARDLGCPWWRIHWRIVIPHAKPGIAVGCIMTFMLAVGTYAVPAILGGTSGIWFTQIIYSWFFDGGNWNQGSAYAFVLLTLCVLFVMLMLRVFRVKMEDIAK